MSEIMTPEKYNNVVKMLGSTDQENQILALGILESHDFLENSAFILMCKKQGHANNALWEEHAPSHANAIAEIKCLDSSKALTFKSVLRALVELKAPIEQIDFFLKRFGDYLVDQMQALGYDFIEDIQMNIKLKEDYGQ